jgi:hypothetical protein
MIVRIVVEAMYKIVYMVGLNHMRVIRSPILSPQIWHR